MKRIEITDIDIERNGINVDFEDGDIVVNFTFRDEDLPFLKQLVADVEDELRELSKLKEKQKKKEKLLETEP